MVWAAEIAALVAREETGGAMGSNRDGRRRALRVALLAMGLLVLALAGCGGPVARGQAPGATATAVAPPIGTTVTRDVAYGPLPAERLDLCLPQQVSSLHAAVLFLHGGGWRAGDKSAFAVQCGQLAALGFVAVTVDYRLSQNAPWPAQLVDAQLAVRWLRAQAARFDLDPLRVCAWGFSAGGHLAALLGELDTSHPGDQAALYAGESPKVDCVVDEAGPADLAAVQTEPLRDMVIQLFGGRTAEQDPTAYQDGSPIAYAAADAAPMLILHGTRDTTVPLEQSLALVSALRAAGASAQLVTFDGEHARVGLTRSQSDALDAQFVAFVRAALRA